MEKTTHTGLVITITLILLTFHSPSAISIGSSRVPSPTVINKGIGYVYNADRKAMESMIAKADVGLFGKVWSEEEARKLLEKGKLAIQSRNCMVNKRDN